jgi:hypothetical protein
MREGGALWQRLIDADVLPELRKDGEVGMTTNEIVRQLRNGLRVGITSDLIEQAADRLEELDERVAIMSEGKTGHWEKDFIGGDDDAFRYRCSRCRKYRDYPEAYCPNCGARMEVEDAAENG